MLIQEKAKSSKIMSYHGLTYFSRIEKWNMQNVCAQHADSRKYRNCRTSYLTTGLHTLATCKDGEWKNLYPKHANLRKCQELRNSYLTMGLHTVAAFERTNLRNLCTRHAGPRKCRNRLNSYLTTGLHSRIQGQKITRSVSQACKFKKGRKPPKPSTVMNTLGAFDGGHMPGLFSQHAGPRTYKNCPNSYLATPSCIPRMGNCNICIRNMRMQ